jgi:hypothetical protein
MTVVAGAVIRRTAADLFACAHAVGLIDDRRLLSSPGWQATHFAS